MVSSFLKKHQFLWIFFLLVLVACEEEVPIPEPGNPEDLHFVGSWVGNTSQMKLIDLEVENVNDWAQLTYCHLSYLADTFYKQRIISNRGGISALNTGHLNFELPDGGSIYSIFSNKNTCNGVLNIFNESTGKIEQHTFIAIPDTSEINIHSTARTSFRVDGIPFDFRQDYDEFFPETENVLTDSGIIAGATFCRSDNTYEGKKMIWIRAGLLSSVDEISTVFSVGEKSLSVDAKRRFEVIYYDPEMFYIPWSTSAFPESQTDYIFEITSFEEIETIDKDYKLYKFIANFKVKVYLRWGSYKQIDDGFFIGYVDTKLPK